MSRDHIGFTLNVRAFVALMMLDPTTRAEVFGGVQDWKNDQSPALTDPLGAANLTPGEGNEATWCSLFPATQQGKNPGEAGLFYRNNSNGGKGDRIQMRLRRQKKRQQVATQAQAGQPLPQQGTVAGADLVTLLSSLSQDQVKAALALAKSGAPNQSPENSPEIKDQENPPEFEIPEDIAELMESDTPLTL